MFFCRFYPESNHQLALFDMSGNVYKWAKSRF